MRQCEPGRARLIGVSVIAMIALAGCTFSPRRPSAQDAGRPDAAPLRDAGDRDGGGAMDARIDGGPDDRDGGGRDGGDRDGGNEDASVPDAGTTDAGLEDGSVVDAGEEDGGVLDAGSRDGGVRDGGVRDAGTPDAGTPDAGVDVATAIVWRSPNPTMAAGDCSQPMRVERVDGTGAAAPDGSPLTLFLNYATNPITFHNPGCAAPQLAAVTILPFASSASFAMQGAAAGIGAVIVSSPGFNDLSATVTITSGPPSQFVYLTAAQTTPWNRCSNAVVIERRDQFNNPASPAFTTTASISVVPPGGVAIFADSACSIPVETIDIVPGASQARFYYRPAIFESVVLEAVAPSIFAISQTQTITDCPDACNVACSECCLAGCPAGACAPTCGAASPCPCELDCTLASGCDTSCVSNTCGVECPVGGPCAGNCNAGDCTYDCRNASSCTVACDASSTCAVHCPTGGGSCNVTCSSRTDCGNGLIVCGTTCP